MVRTYVRTTNRKVMPATVLKKAKHMVASGTSIRYAVEKLKVNKCTLRKRLREGIASKKLDRFSRTFTDSQEAEIADHCRQLHDMLYGLSLRICRRIIYEYATKNQIKHTFNTESRMCGRDWVRSFMKRHRLSLRTPMKTSIARAMPFNLFQVKLFFDHLSEIKERFQFQSFQIFNFDESGFSTVPNTVEKIVSPTGSKTVSKVVSAETGTLITSICCFSAADLIAPPIFIFPRKRNKPELLIGAPIGSKMFVSNSGYVNADIFLAWLKHFISFVRPSTAHQILLILDNHCSHITLDIMDYSRQPFKYTTAFVPQITAPGSRFICKVDRILLASL